MALSSVSVPGYLGQLPGFLPPKALPSEVVMRRIPSQAEEAVRVLALRLFKWFCRVCLVEILIQNNCRKFSC